MSNYSDSSFDESNSNSSWHKVLQLIPEGSVVLDVGCSSGNFGAELAKRKSCKVNGIEIDPGDAKKAVKKLGKVWVLDIERDSLDEVTGKYDVIYFGDVIEHLVSPVNALHKIKPLLNPGGRVVFSIPNMAHTAIRLQMLKGDFEYTETGLLDKTHLHFYNLGEIEKVFEEAGYKILKLDFVEKDFPDDLIKDYLAKLGLKANKKFLELMHQVDAAAFQFVGEAVVKSPGLKPVRRRQFGPIDFFDSFHKDVVNSLSSRIKELELKVASLETKNNLLENRWEELTSNPLKFAVKAGKRRFRGG